MKYQIILYKKQIICTKYQIIWTNYQIISTYLLWTQWARGHPGRQPRSRSWWGWCKNGRDWEKLCEYSKHSRLLWWYLHWGESEGEVAHDGGFHRVLVEPEHQAAQVCHLHLVGILVLQDVPGAHELVVMDDLEEKDPPDVTPTTHPIHIQIWLSRRDWTLKVGLIVLVKSEAVCESSNESTWKE